MRQAKTRLERQQGFSLVEALGASVIIVIGLGGLGAVVVSGGSLRESSGEQTRVLHAAQGMMEEILATSPSSIAAQFDGMKRTLPNSGIGGSGEAFLSVSVVALQPKLLDVRVTGEFSVRGKQASLELRTEVYESR